MRELLLGNEAIARGAYEAGVTVATAYPGTPSTEIVEQITRYPEIYAEWAPNEKVALEVGIGASIGGARTLVAMKHVGVNVAADPLMTFAYTGVNGGLVLISADDPGMHSSQNEQDNRLYARFAKIPLLEPADSQEAKDFVKLAYIISEQFDTPVMVRVTTRLAHSQSLVELGEREEIKLKPYTKDAAKYVMLPGYARTRHVKVEERLLALAAYAEQTPLNRIEWGDRSVGIITSGVVYQYAREVMPTASFLKLGMTNPLPKKLITEFVQGVDRVYVVEELEPYLEEQIRSWGLKVTGKQVLPVVGEFNPELIAEKLLGQPPVEVYQVEENVPARPPVMCPGCPHRGVFYVLNKLKLRVTGDIGCYTLGALPPLNAIDTCICMGASIGTALGMEKARGREFAQGVVAVIGDSTFVHSGITPLIDVVYNRGTTTVIILDNGTTAMTGHQDHPGTGVTVDRQPTHQLDLVKLVEAIGVQRITVVDPFDLTRMESVVKEELAAAEPSVIIARRRCALLDKPADLKLRIDPEKCTGCRLCLRLGCPGLELRDKKVRINETICVGCQLCTQICRLNAFEKVGGQNA